jgi:hypothetical protein
MVLAYAMWRFSWTAITAGQYEIAIGEKEKMEYLKAGFSVIKCREVTESSLRD